MRAEIGTPTKSLYMGRSFTTTDASSRGLKSTVGIRCLRRGRGLFIVLSMYSLAGIVPMQKPRMLLVYSPRISKAFRSNESNSVKIRPLTNVDCEKGSDIVERYRKLSWERKEEGREMLVNASITDNTLGRALDVAMSHEANGRVMAMTTGET